MGVLGIRKEKRIALQYTFIKQKSSQAAYLIVEMSGQFFRFFSNFSAMKPLAKRNELKYWKIHESVS